MVLSGRVSDFDPDYFLQDISGNTINGAPLVYIRGDENTDIDPDAAQIIAVNVSDLEISGYTFDQVASGIQLAHGQKRNRHRHPCDGSYHLHPRRNHTDRNL